MSAGTDHLRILDDMITEAVAAGVGHHSAEDERLAGRTIRLHGRDLVNFASCSYLGLELDPRIILGVVDAVTRFGSQFSSSRVFVSAPGYRELEEQLATLFGADTLVAPSTTLGHLATLPVVVRPGDAALLDHHVHNSIQMASSLLSSAGTRVEMVRHHALDHLQERFEALKNKHERVWLLIDGVCSMFGDLAPIADLLELADRLDNLYLYVDDAHGMSWCGSHGRGYALRDAPLHPKMVLATSLNKAFGAAGGAFVFPDAEMRRRVRTCGATLLFSGPIQPPMLGAALASARVHLSPEFGELQARFAQHAEYCHALVEAASLPICSDPISPVQFLEVGRPQDAQQLAKKLMDDGYFANVAQFPAVPIKRAGIRFTLTLHQRKEDLRGLIDSLERHCAPARNHAKSTPAARASVDRLRPSSPPTHLHIETADSIDQLPEADWNRMLGDRGCFDTHGLRLLERVFRKNEQERNRWGFHYYRVLDDEGTTRAATFCTDAIWKADMLAPATVSLEVERERERQNNPFHLTDRVFSMGCLLSEGNHLYLDPSLGPAGSPGTQGALGLIVNAIQKDAENAGCNSVALRDLDDPTGELGRYLRGQGFIGLPLPDSMELELSWSDEADFMNGLSRKARYHQRRAVRPFDEHFRVETFSASHNPPSRVELDRFFELYANVKANNLEINTFDLPRNLFDEFAQDERWEFIALIPATSPAGSPAVGVGICYVGARHMVPLIMGLDYRYVETQGLYRQVLRHTIERARTLGVRRLCLGMGADLEKRRFGARGHGRHLFLQTRDPYVYDAVAQMSIDSTGKPG